MRAMEFLLCLLLVAMLVPVGVLLAQVLLALAGRGEGEIAVGRRPAVTILMPAHDEASVIVDTVRSIVPQLEAQDRLLVVADNCSDDTAALAAREGATVIERRDEERRGKSYAVEFGLRHLVQAPPEVLIVVDADCRVLDGAIERLARACSALGRPVQSLYLMLAPKDARLTVQVAAFAWIVRNWVRPLGMWRVGLPCQLMGCGMAFPWNTVAAGRMPHAEIAEDYKLGIDLALGGSPPLFCPEAKVTSPFPAARRSQDTQRTRWEHGHLQLIVREVPRLLVRAAAGRSAALLALALDLLVPPLALLAALLVATAVLSLALALSTDLYWPIATTAVTLGLFAAAIALAWYGWGRNTLSAASLLSIPWYVLQKIPLYLRFVTKRQKSWVKTRRD